VRSLDQIANVTVRIERAFQSKFVRQPSAFNQPTDRSLAAKRVWASFVHGEQHGTSVSSSVVAFRDPNSDSGNGVFFAASRQACEIIEPEELHSHPAFLTTRWSGFSPPFTDSKAQGFLVLEGRD
jgi:hypothetical protein